MSGEADKEAPAGRRARRRRRPRWWSGPVWVVAWVSLAALILILGVGVLTGRALIAPGWMVAEAEARVNAALGDRAKVRIGRIEAIVDDDYVPRLRLADVEVMSPSGALLARLPDLRASFVMEALLAGRVAGRTLTIDGATLAIRRLEDGRLNILPPAAEGALPAAGRTPAEILDAVDAAFAAPALRDVERIEVTGLKITFDDARTRQVWEVTNGALILTQTADRLETEVRFALAEEGRAPAQARIDLRTHKASAAAELSARVTGVSARSVAAQSPALAWLSLLDAPIAGTFRTSTDAAGNVGALDATLDIGAGTLRPQLSQVPVAFGRARMALRYDPETGELGLSDIELRSAALSLKGDATGSVIGVEAGFPEALVAQLRLSEVRLDRPDLFADVLSFPAGSADIKLTLDPFRLHVGQAVLEAEGAAIVASADFAAADGALDIAADAAIDRIAATDLLALWPLGLSKGTRVWLVRNVEAGEIFGLKAAFRDRPEGPPQVAAGFQFRDGRVKVLRSLPPVERARGYAMLEGRTYSLFLEGGDMRAPKGGTIDVSGSVFRIGDIRQKPALATVDLRTKSAITAALSILDEPPFRFMTKSGRAVDLFEGRAETAATLSFPLKPRLQPGEVDFTAEAALSDVRSDRLVRGRELVAPALTLAADPTLVRITGEGTLSGVPFDATWTQPIGKGAPQTSSVEGGIELSPRFLDAFGIALPRGSVEGEGRGAFRLSMPRGEPVGFEMASDLEGLRLAVAPVGWSKGPDRTGRLEVSGTLGTADGAPPVVERLSVEAPGLSAEGDLRLREGGSLDRVNLPEVRIGDWFSGRIDIVGRGAGNLPGIEVRGGTANLGRSGLGGGSGGGGGSAISVALDRLEITESIALTGFSGQFESAGGLSGRFKGSVNGSAPVIGTAAPLETGTGFRVRAEDAGAVFRAARMFTRARGGALDMTLRPTGERGVYEGTLSVSRIRVVGAPVLAELLNAVSVVGLLDQLNGTGILFEDVFGTFRIVPDGVVIREGSAIGASLGVSMSGTYQSATKAIDLQGTISPIYLINSIGGLFSRQREGLFGFNYRLTGTSDAPRVAVNPLSILTPGMFREIFRSPPPTLPGGG